MPIIMTALRVSFRHAADGGGARNGSNKRSTRRAVIGGLLAGNLHDAFRGADDLLNLHRT